MTKHLPPMWNDPKEDRVVRELLQAGRSAGSEGYDLSSGLLKHAAHIKAGTPAPSWASETLTSASTSGAAGTAATLPLWGVVAVSVLGAAAGAILWSDAVTSPSPHVATTVVAPDVSQPGIDSHEVQPPESVVNDEALARPLDAVQGVEPTMVNPANSAPITRGERRVRASAATARSASPAPPSASPSLDVVPHGGDSIAAGTSPGQASQTSQVASTSKALTLDEVVTRAVRATEASSSTSDSMAQPKAAAIVRPEAAASSREELLEREMRMLKVAQAVLETDPARSLRLAEMGEREFSGSMFTQERQYVLIVALARLGRTSEAHRLAGAYLSKYPSGPFSERVRKALGVR